MKDYDTHTKDKIYKGVELRDLIELIYSEKPYKSSEGEEYPDFYQFMKVKHGKRDYKSKPYEILPPAYFDSILGEGDIGPEFSYREVSYSQATPVASIPLMPKECVVNEKNKIIWISEDEVWFESEA